ncbi:Integrase catalytic core protein [Phytophthora palmivora]|uniref:Integrase catalytic core protein n=1 Tax=Phytophthora palmivora TaxID=4796 RepID=A0A2P4YS14_9STRA|nr:Integrase catalytic core protein [Phytophthora palmivora]
MGFVRCNKEYCIYVQNVGVEWVIMVIYVDDLTIMSKSMRLINKIKAELSMRFKMKDLGNISYILKMEIIRNRVDKTMSISQHRYISELLKKYNIENSSVVATPQVTGLELEPETKMTAEQIAAQKFDYRGYTTRHCKCSKGIEKYLSCYNRSHWEAARRVLKYLKGTSTYGLLLDGKSREVMYEVYTDASFACQSKERKSITGYVIRMAGCSISWCSSKQGSVSLSAAEAELIALSEGTKEREWL